MVGIGGLGQDLRPSQQVLGRARQVTVGGSRARPLLAMRTISHPDSTGARRTASLSRLLTRFLTTAPPTLLPTTNPNRLVSRPLGTFLRTNNRLDHARLSWRILEKPLVPGQALLFPHPAPRRLDRRFVTALEPAASKHSPAPGSARPGPEPMDALTTAFLWLISTFRHNVLPADGL